MSGPREEPIHDRALLLHGPKRNEVLSLREVQRYGIDSYGDADYLRLYGMTPTEWSARGVRVLGRTAVECTRDPLADRIGADVAGLAAKLSSPTRFVVVDPFAGSCNTLYWILRHLPGSTGIACELDAQVHDLSRRNIAGLGAEIELSHGDHRSLIDGLDVPLDCAVIVFVAPPWGTALDELVGLDLRRTAPPIADIIDAFDRKLPDHRILFATQVYETLNPSSLADVRAMLDKPELRVYDLNPAGRNHGILLGTRRWLP